MTDNEEFSTLDEARREIVRLRREAISLAHDVPQPRASGPRQPLSETEESLQRLYTGLLLSHTPNMIFLFDEEQEYVVGSDACRRLTRQENAVLTHRPLPLLFCKEVDGRWVEKINRLNTEVFKTRREVRFHDTIHIEDAGVIHVHVTMAPMLDDSGKCRGTIVAINDESEIVAAKRRAEETAKSKASFLANMSHEIRTPMNAIKGLSELLALTDLNHTQQNYVQNIVGSAKSLIGIINDVLDFSKIDANRIEFVNAPYSLNRIVADICGIIGLRAEEKGLSFFLEISPDIPSRLVGDDSRIKQILLNLLSNAVKYTKSGHVLFRLTGERMAEGRIGLAFRIEDTGVGIKSEDVPKMFSAFSRFDLLANRAIEGTGLGLAISKQLAEAMGGTIELESEYGKGSVFTLFIPQAEGGEDSPPLASLEEPENVRVLLVGSGPRLNNARRILESLGAACAFLDDSGTDVGLARKLSRLKLDLPDCGNPPGPYTHCIYSDVLPDRDIASLRARMPNVRFACLRSIINSIQEPGRRDVMLFNPLIVTEVAKFLNKSGKRTVHIHNGSDTSITRTLRVRDTTVLVVDDNRINLLVCEKMLNLYGVEVKTAPGGEEGLKMCRERRFDLLFVDHMMPGMDGVEMTAEVRRADSGLNMKTPIIALTANVVNDMRSYYLKCGMDDFVGKPIDRAELCRVLMRWLPPEKIVAKPEALANAR